MPLQWLLWTLLLGPSKTLGEPDGETKDTCKSKEELKTMPEYVE
jgi:hypothetical protein